MRPILLIIPSFLALASAGGLWLVASAAKKSQSFEPTDEWKHPVTQAMLVKTGAMKQKVAPHFNVTDMSGNKISIGGQGLKRPQFVYFVNDGCPCSYAAEPLFHSLADRFKGQVDFVAVTNGTPAQAKKWISEMQVEYPLVSDAKVDIMKAYCAASSAYSALITPDGKIDEMWPGFSKSLLLDMNREMARITAQTEKTFDPQYAPDRPVTGCSF